MRRHINFALTGNMNIHMYDPTLKLVQAVRNPNPPKVLPSSLSSAVKEVAEKERKEKDASTINEEKETMENENKENSTLNDEEDAENDGKKKESEDNRTGTEGGIEVIE